MKVLKLLILFSFQFNNFLFAQISVDSNAPFNTLEYLVDSLLIGDGVTSSNHSFIGDSAQIGFFNGINSNIGLDSGIILSTGSISSIVPQTDDINFTNTNTSEDLLAIANSVPNLIGQNFTILDINDVAILEFDFIPLSSNLSFEYVFASSEYYAFENTSFNDVFGFFISGPNINGPYSSPAEFPNGSINIATFESQEQNSFGVDLPITISSVNANYNPYLFVSNQANGSNSVNSDVDGFTKVFTAKATVLCGEKYHIRLAIADAEDSSFSSYVLLGAGSFSSPPISLASNLNINSNSIFTDCNEPAILSVDVEDPSDYEFLWNTGDTTDQISATPGYYWVSATDTLGCTVTSDSIYVYSQPIPEIIMPDEHHFCENDTYQISPTINSGTAPFTYYWNGLANTQQLIVNQEDTYTLTVVDSNGCTDSKAINITQEPLPELSFSPQDILVCAGDSVDVSVSGAKTYSWSPNIGLSSDTGSTVNISASTSISYTLEGTDSLGCVNSIHIPISATDGFDLDISTTPVSCQGYKDGSITILPQNTAVSPIRYSIDGGENFSSFYIFNNLDYGTYNIVVQDGLGCNVYDTVFIQSSQPEIELIISSTNPLCANDSLGTVSVSEVFGGTVEEAYSFKWFNSNNNQIVGTDSSVNVPAGSYYLVVEDDNGCKATDEVSVEQPNSLFYTLTKNDVSCHGKSDGQINIEIHGGVTPPYNFNWVNYGNSSTPFLYNLGKGIYNLEISDANNCINSVSVEIKESLAPLSLELDSSNINCFGDSNGSAQAIATGGTPPYSYQWSSGHISDVAPQLSSGVYFLEVTDAMNCVIVDSIQVTENAEIVSNINSTPTTCFGSQDGSASIQALGGTGNLTYNWSTGNNTTAISSGFGEYWVKVEDSLGCIVYDTIQINQPQKISVRLITTDVNCFGDFDGRIESIIFGGTPLNNQTYIYDWSIDGNLISNNNFVNNLPPSTSPYMLKVTDANGCSKMAYTFINQPTELKLDTSEIIAAYCHNVPTGLASVVASGGVLKSNSDYIFEWNTGDSGSILSNKTAGIYTVVVKDNNSCKDTLVVEIPLEDNFTLSMTFDSLNCYENGGGSATVMSNGGFPPYSYDWNTSSGVVQQTSSSNTHTITNLDHGVTSVVVTDDNGCTKTSQVTVEQADELLFSVYRIKNESCSGQVSSCDGELKVVATGGTGSYTFNLYDSSNNLKQTNQSDSETIFSNLCADFYHITVSDKYSCSGVLSGSGLSLPVEIIAGSPVESFINTSTGSISNNILCYGDTSVSLSVLNPNYSYTYDWYVDSNYISSGTSAILPAGEIFVRAISSSSCYTNSSSITIFQPSLLSINSDVQSIKCNGTNTGSISVEASGGFPNYIYSWSSGDTYVAGITNLSNLSSGTYTLSLKDANGCERIFDFEIEQPMPLSVNPIVQDASCNQGNNGSAELSISGGTMPYSIDWQGFDSTSLSAGSYSVEIKDANNCSKLIDVSVGESSPIVANFNINQTPFNASASGGTPPYTFKWLYYGNFQSSGNNYMPTDNGEYTLVVTDSKNCNNRIMKSYTSVGVDEENELEVLIYPNPVSDNFIVEVQSASKNDNEYTFKLLDYRGRLLKKDTFKNRLNIDRNNLAKGLYVIIISSENNIYQQTLIFE